MPRRLEHDDHFAAAQRPDVEHRAARREFVLAACEGLLHEAAQILIDDLRSLGADQAAVASRARQHRERRTCICRLAQHQNARAVHVEQRCDLGEHPLGEPLHRLEIEQRRCRLDDDFQSATGLDHALQLLVAAQRRGQRGEQLVGGELRLGLVVVNVVIDDDAPFRRLARLTGAQNDAHGFVFELVANEFD